MPTVITIWFAIKTARRFAPRFQLSKTSHRLFASGSVSIPESGPPPDSLNALQFNNSILGSIRWRIAALHGAECAPGQQDDSPDATDLAALLVPVALRFGCC
jgi:hypothetical protein